MLEQNVKDIINSKSLKFCGVAKMIGVKPKTFSAMLNGRQIIRPEVIAKLCKVLDVTPNQLFNIA